MVRSLVSLPSPIIIATVRRNERNRQIKMHDHHQRHHNYTEIVAATSIHFGHKNMKLKKKLLVRPQSAHHNNVCGYKPQWKTLYFLFGCCASHACVGLCAPLSRPLSNIKMLFIWLLRITNKIFNVMLAHACSSMPAVDCQSRCSGWCFFASIA